jgi:hypothetical protein
MPKKSNEFDKLTASEFDRLTLNNFELLFLGAASGLPLNLEEPFTKLPHWKVKQTILTHFMPGQEKKEKSIIAMAKKYEVSPMANLAFGGKNFRLAKDGMRVK